MNAIRNTIVSYSLFCSSLTLVTVVYMASFDLLLLTIYFLCVTSVLVRVIDSFNDEFFIIVDKDELKKQLEGVKLADRVDISFGFNGRYEFHTLKEFGVNVKNKSNDHPLYVDWNASSLTDLDGKARRVTRLIPGNSIDLFQQQALSPVAANNTLKEKIVAEDMLKRKGDDGPLEIDKTLLDLSKPKKPGDALTRYLAFMSLQGQLKFSLNLMLRVVNDGTPSTGYGIPIRCDFSLQKLHWHAGLPWNPKD